MDSLEELEREKEEIEGESRRITEVSKEALLFVNDRDGIIETALSLKTYTNPADLEAVRELIHIFIERVELFADGHGVIYYNLPVCRRRLEGDQAMEPIYFKKKSPHTSESCGLAQTTGIDPRCSSFPRTSAGFPRTRGDRPSLRILC